MRSFKFWCGVSASSLLGLGLNVTEVMAQTAGTRNWTGFYAGSHIGNAAAANNWNSADGIFANASPFAGQFTGGGILGGLQAGYNRQFGQMVLGIEADASSADIDGAARCAVGLYVCESKIDALGTVTGRLGYAYGQFLFYAKAGGAWAHEKLQMVPSPGNGLNRIFDGKELRFGWTVGAGAEYAFTSAISARLEYNYLGLGHDTVVVTDQLGSSANVSLAQQIHLFKLGLNYKLSETPPFGTPAVRDSAPSWNWNGAYVGVHGGGAFGVTDWNSATGVLHTVSTSTFPGSGSSDGMIAGGQIGFNRHFGPWVIGGELDVSWSNLDGYAKCATSENPVRSFTCRTRINALATLAGRIGRTYGNLLVYSKAGGAWAHGGSGAYRVGVPNIFTALGARSGYMLGTGVEYAFTPAWSGKIEYNYLDFGTKTIAFNDQFGNRSDIEIGQRAHVFKTGLNYKLGVDPSAAPSGDGSLVVKAPRRSDWVMEVGSRYWFSSGGMQKDLYDNANPDLLNSRLIYSGLEGHSVESFARFDHRSGLFAKGNFGLGTLVNGHLNDEDFPPYTAPYSNTLHPTKDGGLRYGSLDVGYNVLNGPAGKLGAFVGYRYFYQRGRGFGCTQIATGNICAAPISSEALGLTETEQWRGAAVGLNAQLALTRRLKLEADAAYLPYVNHAAVDNHWLRADINPMTEPGHGWGTQVEAILSYAVTDRLNVGVGGRYWFFTSTDAGTRFPGSATVSPIKFTSDRYGGFLQASYKFGGADDQRLVATEEAPPANWTGLYAGAHLGAGFGRSDWSDPFPPGPTGDRVSMGGALGGGQVGFNYQTGRAVFGVEASGSWARIEGTETCFGGIAPATLAGLNCENSLEALGTLTGRLGYAVNRSLIYAKGGAALARHTYALNSNGIANGTISSNTATNWGWTAGAGVEHALTSRWSVNVEYKYLDFGSRSVGFAVPAAIAAASNETIDTHSHLVTMGVNYRFDGLLR